MAGRKNWHLRSVISAATLGLLTGPALAFFPPVFAPINQPNTTTKLPTNEPVKIPPVDPCVKPHPKPRPHPTDCGCTPNQGTANTPEPATLLSAGIGVALAGAVGWMKSRRKQSSI